MKLASCKCGGCGRGKRERMCLLIVVARTGVCMAVRISVVQTRLKVKRERERTEICKAAVRAGMIEGDGSQNGGDGDLKAVLRWLR